MGTGSEGGSWTSPSSDLDLASPSSLVPSHAMTSPSLVTRTSQARGLSPPVPATSPGAPGMLGTTGTLSTSLGRVTSSPSDVSSTSVETRVISEASTATEGLHLPGNTAVTNVGTITSAQESQSSEPAGSETPKGTTPTITSSLSSYATVSTRMAGLSATTELETQSMSSLAPELGDTSASQHTIMASKKVIVPSVTSPDTTDEAARSDVISSSRTPIPGPALSTLSPDMPTAINTRLSTSPVMTESTAVTMHTETGLPGATLQSTGTSDASATASWAESHSAGTQGFAHPVVTISMGTGSEDGSRTSPSSDLDLTSPSSLVPSHAMTSPSLVTRTSQARSLSPPVPATSPGAPGLLGTTSTLSTSLGHVTSSPSDVSSTSVETWVISEASTAIEGLHLPGNTAVTNVGTITSTKESQSSEPAGSETPKGTTPTVTSSLSGDATVSTRMGGLSETTELETESMSSLAPELGNTRASWHTVIASEKVTVPSVMSTDTTDEASRTDVISFSRISIPGPAPSTLSPDMPTAINTRLSTSSVMTESTAETMATETGLPGDTSQSTGTSDASATASWAESHSAGIQGFAHPDVTVSMGTGSEGGSWTSPSSDLDLASPSSLRDSTFLGTQQ
ncbi:mucin-16-like [Mirounga angustirostris]|uniref:mucin-16-like n=1 Tax=Mirounga angustirostris TaxID=9716 RepID=UPI00313EECAE